MNRCYFPASIWGSQSEERKYISLLLSYRLWLDKKNQSIPLGPWAPPSQPHPTYLLLTEPAVSPSGTLSQGNESSHHKDTSRILMKHWVAAGIKNLESEPVLNGGERLPSLCLRRITMSHLRWCLACSCFVFFTLDGFHAFILKCVPYLFKAGVQGGLCTLWYSKP